MIRVFKFGGALLSSAENLKHMAGLVDEFKCQPLVVVVSAIGKTTNALESLLKTALTKQDSLAEEYFRLKSFHLNLIRSLKLENGDQLMTEIEELFRELWDALNRSYEDFYFAYDQIVSFGERFSGRVVTRLLEEKELVVQELDAASVIVTDDNYTNATVDWAKTIEQVEKEVLPVLRDQKVVVTHGFVAGNGQGFRTTLGREGSDFTAAVLAGILHADETIIWKDVPGLMNADPHLFPDAVKLEKISYHEAVELAFYGAKVLHPKTIQPLQKKHIALQIRSFFQPFEKPTIISEEGDDDRVGKIIVKKDQVLLSISSRTLDFIAEKHLHKIFRSFSKNKVHVNIMQHSAVSFSVAFDYDEKKLQGILNDLREEFYLKYNTQLELYTFRHYPPEQIQAMTEGKSVYLEQKSRITVQLLLK